MTVYARARSEWNAVLAALAFLTRVPIPQGTPFHVDDLPRSTPYFPLVGLIVGATGGLVFGAASMLWPPAVAVVLSVAATVRLTGAFHEDAVADLCDGFGGGWNREQILRIMKDSRVGAYGVVGLVLVMLTKVLALDAIATTLVTRGSGVGQATVVMTQVMIAAHVLGRWSSLPLIRFYSYVRSNDSADRPGTGKPFASSVTNGRLIVGTLLTLIILTIALRHRAIAVGMIGMMITWICGRYFHRRIGGITGDVLGGANQFVELATYLVLAAAPHMS